MYGQHAEDKPAADALTKNKFIQIKKMLMITFETLRAYQGPPAWNEHLPYGAFGKLILILIILNDYNHCRCFVIISIV